MTNSPTCPCTLGTGYVGTSSKGMLFLLVTAPTKEAKPEPQTTPTSGTRPPKCSRRQAVTRCTSTSVCPAMVQGSCEAGARWCWCAQHGRRKLAPEGDTRESCPPGHCTSEGLQLTGIHGKLSQGGWGLQGGSQGEQQNCVGMKRLLSATDWPAHCPPAAPDLRTLITSAVRSLCSSLAPCRVSGHCVGKSRNGRASLRQSRPHFQPLGRPSRQRFIEVSAPAKRRGPLASGPS